MKKIFSNLGVLAQDDLAELPLEVREDHKTSLLSH